MGELFKRKTFPGKYGCQDLSDLSSHIGNGIRANTGSDLLLLRTLGLAQMLTPGCLCEAETSGRRTVRPAEEKSER